MTDNMRQLRPPREPWDVTKHAAVDDARFVAAQEFLDGPAGHGCVPRAGRAGGVRGGRG